MLSVDKGETDACFALANRCFVGDGISVPVDESDDADELSSSAL